MKLIKRINFEAVLMYGGVLGILTAVVFALAGQ